MEDRCVLGTEVSEMLAGAHKATLFTFRFV